MKIEIRRNQSWNISFQMTEENKEAIRHLTGDMPKLTKEQEELMEKGRQEIANIKEKIWAYLDENPTTDCLGDLITRETHMIDFDTETVEKDGCMWAVPKQFYIQPIKSEHDKQWRPNYK